MWSQDLREELQGEPEGPQPTESKDDAVRKDLWLSKVTSSIVVTQNLEFNSMCRKKKTFLFPLKYFDVTSTVHTSLDV